MRYSLFLLVFLAASVAFPGKVAAGSPNKSPSDRGVTTVSKFTRSVWLDVSRVKIHLNNRGALDNNPPGGNGGAYWPDASNPHRNVVLFDFGPWVVGKLNGVPKMGLSQWGSSYSPGPAIDGQAALVARPADSLRYRLYRITRGDSAGSNPDYSDWPVDLGAPLDAQGKPRLYGDQTIWGVFNNLDTLAPSDWWRRNMPMPGLPVVIQQAVYAHQVPGGDTTALLGNVALIEWTIINVGDVPIESTYVSLWTDIDFNDVTRNLPAVDTVNQLGYCWQVLGGVTYGPPRAVGFVWLYGPSVPSAGSQALFKGRPRVNFRNLPMSSFWGIQTGSSEDSSFGGPAYSMGTAWNIARGFDKAGNPILDSMTHQETKFLYSGDPVTGSGWLCPHSSGGAGFNMFSGPFTLASHDTQWVMAALIPVSDPDPLECVRLIRQSAATLRAMSYQSIVVTSVPDQASPLPARGELAQNYPNPFNPSTTIRYGLPQRAHVMLTVFNTLGQQVAVVQNGEQEVGYHEVKFDGSNLASGVYFYRMQAGTYVQTRKLLLMK